MRTLRFIVEGQIIKKDPDCDFTNIVPGTRGYLQAEFSFSPEWDKTVKVASFFDDYREFPPQLLEDGRVCMIPAEALVKKSFKIRVIGRDGDLKILTNFVEVCQDGGKR